ncbi:MAG: hypothetical protein WAV28_07690 [Sedimentisphaerales bacterium]
MSKTFVCKHCGRRYKKNPRLKTPQNYCSSKPCQQARKNTWEREKLKKDPVYKAKRKADKKKWYLRYPGNRYHSVYRATHPLYCDCNRKKQRERNQRRPYYKWGEKIVKTDALSLESIDTRGLYVLIPYQKVQGRGKIVKTDALVVQMVAGRGIGSDLLQNSS